MSKRDLMQTQSSSPELITPTEWGYDPVQIAAAFKRFAEMPLSHNAYEGAGVGPEAEMDFSIINEEFRGTIFQQILDDLPCRFGRTRLMCIPPQRCYPVHSDQAIRYHLAIATHPFAFIALPLVGKIYHIPEDGYLYRMDPREPHTAINCGPFPRYHLVIVTDER